MKQKALDTIKLILGCLEHDPGASAVFSHTSIEGQNLMAMLTDAMRSGTITKAVVQRVYPIIKSLLNSEILFSSKRKRVEEETQQQQQQQQHQHQQAKRPRTTDTFHQQIAAAAHAIASNFTASVLDPALVSSLQLPLHQLFLFSVTMSARQGPYAHVLQEISGLIQVIGVLAGISIGTNTYQSSPMDIEAAVYPCLHSGCQKIFERLHQLRLHQRSHSDQRPHRCTTCPAAFARSHDLKRHAKLHDRKGWRCGNCLKLFSRRDAIKRHMNRSGAACDGAEITEVEVENDGDQTRDERLSRIWNNGPTDVISSDLDAHEEGELDLGQLVQTQTIVIGLHGLLKSLVGNTSGTAAGATQAVDPSYGQAALASVLARAQSTATASSTPPSTATDQPMLPLSAPTIPNGQAANPYGLSDEQAKILEQAIFNAAAAAQAQAEAEAALERESGLSDDDDELADDG